MKPAETKAIYESACKAKRMPIVQEEATEWHKLLRVFEAVDVKAGLDAWNASTDRDSKGDLKSKWLPTPIELKSLTESAQRKRIAKSAEPHMLVRWQCPACIFSSSAYIPETDMRGRKCRACGAPMNEIMRERAA